MRLWNENEDRNAKSAKISFIGTLQEWERRQLWTNFQEKMDKDLPGRFWSNWKYSDRQGKYELLLLLASQFLILLKWNCTGHNLFLHECCHPWSWHNHNCLDLLISSCLSCLRPVSIENTNMLPRIWIVKYHQRAVNLWSSKELY